MKSWTKDNWREFPIKQQPEYASEDKGRLKEVEQQLASMPALTSPIESRNLREKLALVAEGKAFLLQGGDCAESFAEFNQKNLESYFRVMLQMTTALMYGAGKPIVKVGRIAGQFAKPRSSATETENGLELPAYRGDMVNSMEFSKDKRRSDPENLLKVYFQSTATLNYLRSLSKGGFASLSNISEWNADFVLQSPQGKRFQMIVGQINEALSFMKACGLNIDEMEELKEATFYTSHEGLILNYEAALTQLDEDTGEYYDNSAHMLWIGDRTRGLGEAHIEFFRGISNPIGVKVGPSMKPDELTKLINTLNPKNIAGKLTLISRMGAEKIDNLLPPLISAVEKEGLKVVWSCDPMHGNTIKSPNGYKTRPFNQILAEVKSFFGVHKSLGTHAGGIHIEMTGQDVTECTGGAQAISEINLKDRYHTHCDPRLNASQSLELAFLISEELKKNPG